MLFEKTAYENDFPINLRIMKVKEYPIHYHQDIEFIYVLKASAPTICCEKETCLQSTGMKFMA